jgi:glycosyltransferase involved in cell wall biosynthesis
MTAVNLSIVITTYNRADTLVKLLLNLENQTDPDFQVVVAIDGATDDTESRLAGLRTRYPLDWVNTHCNAYGLAIARNRGILAADGDAVVILDDDSVPVDHFVASHKKSVTNRTITGGPRNPANTEDTRMVWKMEQLARLPYCNPLTIPQMREQWPDAYLIENNVCLYKRDWIALGLFSERLKFYGFIGQEFFGRAEFLGYRYQYNHDAAVNHHGELEGDNGLHRSTKNRQIRISEALRPELMTPRHYTAQVKWAKALSEGADTSGELPPFLLQAATKYPIRRLRTLALRLARRRGKVT